MATFGYYKIAYHQLHILLKNSVLITCTWKKNAFHKQKYLHDLHVNAVRACSVYLLDIYSSEQVD